MKRVTAFIRINMMNKTKEALIASGFSAFTATKVLGRGKGQVDFKVLKGAESGLPEAIAHLKDDGPILVPKRMITIVVSDENVPALVETITKVNQTSRPGDGKIFVQPISEVVRIRTGETNEVALSEK